MSTKKTLDAWKSRRVHKDVTLPSGMVVDIQVPNLPMLMKTGRIPNHLIEAALAMQQSGRVSVENVLEQHEFQRLLISLTLVEPSVTPEEVDEIPFEDQDLLVAIATRLQDTDAVGHQLGGLETVQSFRDLRGV